MPDYSYDGFVNTSTGILRDNNVGGISEADIRSILEFARPHALTVAESDIDISADLNATITTTAGDLEAAYLLTGTPASEVYYQTGSDNWLSVSTESILYSATATQDRLFRYSWQVQAFSDTDVESGQITFYYYPVSQTWPTNVVKLRSQPFQYPEPGTPGTINRLFSTGSALVQLAPGDRLVPTIEINDDTKTLANSFDSVSYVIDVNSVGVVDKTSPSRSLGNPDGWIAFVADSSATAAAIESEIPD
jgi:hypothetical protein